MLKLLRLELKLCFERIECKVIFLLLFFLSIGAFLIDCYRSYGTDIILIRSAYEMTILQSTSTKIFLSIELMILPLLASIIYSDTTYADVKSGVHKSILTRINYNTYICTKAIVILIVTFIVVFLPLFLNQILCLLTFPINGYDNRFGLPPYDIGIQNYDAQAPLDLLRLQAPFLYNVTFMLLIAITASIFALFTYGIFLLQNNKSRFTLFAGVFLTITLLNLVVTFVGTYAWGYNHILLSGNRGSLITLWIWLFTLLVGALAAILINLKKGNLEVDK